MKARNLFPILAMAISLAGCASHPQISSPVVERANSERWDGKSFSYELLYSQPKPGVFSSGQQQELAPIGKAQLSVGSAQVLSNFPTIVDQILPAKASLTKSESSDYALKVALIANDKKGPTYAEYEFGKSLAKGLVTLGLGAAEYNIVADFSVEYTLSNKNGERFSKKYNINESIDNEKGAFEIHDRNSDYAAELLKKHIIVTASSFFSEAKSKL